MARKEIRVQTCEFEEKARKRIAALAKPPGSLTLLEELACFIARAQKTSRPRVANPHVLVFAADHGVAASNPVSAYPTDVTPLMVQTMLRGKAAVSVLSRQARAHLWVVDCGVAVDPTLPGESIQAPDTSFIDARVGAGSADLRQGPAMSENELSKALDAGRNAVSRAAEKDADLIALGELGIGNTTPASAVAAKFLDLSW